MDAITIAIIGIVVAAVIAIGVGIYQVRAGRMRPRPQFRNVALGPGATTLSVEIDNPGGAAVRCIALAQAGDNYYEFRRPVASGTQGLGADMAQLGANLAPETSAVPIVLWVAAEDGNKGWWDVRRGRRIRGGIDPWLQKRSSKAKLAIPIEVDAGV
ncbi:MAG TPA: hypothetical protein VN959_13415 [Mycobacterium sp.]|nr:hypothetical protein [Mycobacterium sp.]